MKTITSFNPSAAASGIFDPQVANPCGRIYLFNESPIGLQLTFQDGSTASLPPYYFRSYVIRKPGIVQWQMIYNLPSTSTLSQVIGEAYESNELKDVNFIEGPLNRQTNVGNQVNVVGGGANFVQNDNNSAGTNIVEATVSGDPNSAVVLTNSAHLTLGTALNSAVVSFVGSLGNFTFKSTGEVDIDNRLLCNLMIAEAGNDMVFSVASTHQFFFQINGVNQISLNGSGLNLLTAPINPNFSPVTVNGSVSGTASLYQYFQGTVKRCLVVLNNYRSAAAQTLTLPVAFSNPSYWIVAELQGGQVEGLLSGTAQTFSVLVTLNISGGTQNPQTSLKQWSQGMLRAGFDTLRVTSTGGAATGILQIEGT